MKVYNRLGNRYSGALGKEVVASSWKGHHYLRAYVVPEDPKSELQLQHRAIFRRAAGAWKKLLPRQKTFYNRIADGMTGYNVFLGRYVAAERGGEEPETPLLTVWRTEDGQPVADGWLLVSRGRQNLFVDSLRDSKVEIALTRSDVPYTFVLKKGAVEDCVLVVDEWPEGGFPTSIESEKLGIRLTADPRRIG